jgi:UDP-N-acetylglucosamine--N-acetylmuramyl-(pentapeptide) pyrophosphoryl-undecaprenol N-acetylglucosamine transferase
MHKKILLIGGGTGGHIVPLKNLAKELVLKKCIVELIVSDSELDKKITNENFAEFPIYFFKTDKIRRYLSWQNLLAPFKIIKSIFSARKLLSEIKPDVVFFKGGFVGFPFFIALVLSNFRGKIYGHESDIESGKLTKLLEKKATKIFYSFGEPAYPLFYSEKNPAKSPSSDSSPNKKKKLLVFGGSQGAQFINELVEKNLDKLTKKFDVTLVTGVGKHVDSPLRKEYGGILGFKQIEMLSAKDLSTEIRKSDLIISRAGANSLFEIISAKKPSLIIPLPSAAKNHQEKNAQFFAKKGLCYIFHQGKDTDFYAKIMKTFDDKKLRENLKKSDFLNSAKKIAKEICN